MSSASTPVVEMQDAALAYGQRRILSQLNLRVYRGERWCVVGDNGAGKTTVLRALLGLLPVASGRITVARDDRGRARIGYVPQHLTVPESVPTTVREFVATGVVGLALSPAQQRAAVHRALAQMELSAHAAQSFAICSGGQRQRAALARAFVRDPLLVMCDEPTTGLDASGVRELSARLRALTNIAQIFVTHDAELVAEVATHVLRIANGTASAAAVTPSC